MEVSGPKSAKAPVISRNVLLKLLTSSEDDLRNANPLITEVFDTRVLSPNSLGIRSEEHTSELQSPCNRVCRPLVRKRHELGRHPRIEDNDLRQHHRVGSTVRDAEARAEGMSHLFFFMLRRPPKSTLFPSTTLFRS